jgi:FxsC-like protein
VIDTGRDPYFFISHAHTPTLPGDTESDALVQRFYEDLSQGVRRAAGATAARAEGFMERHARKDLPLPAHVVHAVTSCRVLVPLFSERYFNDRRCAAEWSLFAKRVKAGEGSPPAVNPIVPALWTPVDAATIQGVARSVTFDPTEFGDTYAEHGLYGLVRLSRFRDDYREVVDHLADKIADVGDQSRLPPVKGVSLTDLPTSFSHPGSRPPLRILVAACTADVTPGAGGAIYGRTPLEWNPYHPDSAKPIGEYAASLVANLGYRPEVLTFDDGYADLLAEGVPTGPGLLIIDPALLRDPRAAGRFRRFDGLDRSWIRVMIPVNMRDGSASDSVVDLQSLIGDVFRRRSDDGRLSVREAITGIRTLETFEVLLPQLVQIASRQYLKGRSHAVRSLDGVPPRVRLQGPRLFNGEHHGEEHDEGP